MDEMPTGELRRGWTTGACAAAAAKSAYVGWVTGEFIDPVVITLPGGQQPAFALASHAVHAEGAQAGIVKDAGDDPDVTHGATVLVHVGPAPAGAGIVFQAGEGVGTVTLPGLPLPVGEPAINPMPREMIRQALAETQAATSGPRDVTVTIAIPGGDIIAQKTMNPRLGIVGGLSILGTTGIVIPFSCAAWIHSIHRGIDVARATGLNHVAGATGSTSEAAIRQLHGLPEQALIDMGDFAGGMLKYLRKHPVARVTIAGGFAKMVKLGQGMLDLHSRAGPVDLAWLSDRLREAGGGEDLAAWVPQANTALEVLQRAQAAGLPLAEVVAGYAWTNAARSLGVPDSELEIAVFDRQGGLVAKTPFRKIG
ncbi:cobalt-precorrin-5B (C(1))-methyltransferase [Bosea sp. PAMC 26642]|uniref:cobalt-precorrin-5B (C(1))-methyltransferase n=1 Tax=Bosea sp. (strain PAMC 26642) TaxID=1792307 RepID=UPI00077001BB|nr:cobalt-precorrin-5B (C(1))-methyltransferase [Bosea sp. PAMC 26642]AMJ63881.1 cobalt-precorrin-5B (C(1))-methyltransferase [Bosea sp. PAMC 26642]